MNLAFCGLKHAHVGSLYALCAQNSDVRILGAWEGEEAYRAAARTWMQVPFYPTLDELLNDKKVDVVVIGDAYGARGQEAIRALKAGKHVLSDKPLCTRMEELEEIERIAGEGHLAVGCMLDLRFDPALRLARNLVRSGELGEIHAINFTGQHPLNYGTRPSWYFDAQLYGGTFNDLAIHGLDAVSMITGLSYARTRCARQYNAFAREAPSFPDCAQLMGEYENGAGLIADVSYSAPAQAAFRLPSYWRFSFWGDKGMIECALGAEKLLLAQAGRDEIRLLTAPKVKENCLTELIRQIRGESTVFPQRMLFDSTRTALEIQRSAEG